MKFIIIHEEFIIIKSKALIINRRLKKNRTPPQRISFPRYFTGNKKYDIFSVIDTECISM
jgi:hypothetical protein